MLRQTIGLVVLILTVIGTRAQPYATGDSYTRIEGLNSSNLAQVYLANVNLDATKQSSDQDATVFLDNSNITPIGTNVTTRAFSTSGSMPSCSFCVR